MKTILVKAIQSALEDMVKVGELSLFDMPLIHIERPKNDRFGEYTSNIALIIAQQIGGNPRELAGQIRERMLLRDQSEKRIFEKIDVAGPGHLNFFLSQSVLAQTIETIETKGSHYGESNFGQEQRVSNEFISANPTGPLTVGNGRSGFLHDVLSRVFRKTGFLVTNEYYINDAGEQIMKLGHSILKDEHAVYGGEYIDTIREQLSEDELHITDDEQHVRVIGEKSAELVLENFIKPSLSDRMGILFDIFTSEKRDIIEKGYVDKALVVFKEKQLTYDEDGALWLKTTAFGDDKDRVLVKSDGTRTYFASDCGYILQKIERGFQRLLIGLGADHHGYVTRFHAAARALGFEGRIDCILVQLVKIVKDGKEVRMSKRAGNIVTVDELIERVGSDVTRFFFLLYSPDTHMNFDLGLAEERSQKNPVYYVQYAHARLVSILEKAREAGLAEDGGDIALLIDPKERLLLAELLSFPDLLQEVADGYAAHRLPQYAIRLADRLHSFYDTCRVVDTENPELSRARLRLVKSVKIVLCETLRLIGVSAPEKM